MRLNAPSSWLFAVCASLAVVSASPTAHAQTSHAEASADARFSAGLKAYDNADYEGARIEFLQAQAIFPRASLLRNLALSELHTNRPLDALTHLRSYIADPGTSPDKRALAERNIQEAYALTGHLSISAPDGAHLKVDGKDVGTAPLKEAVDVAVGLHGVDSEVGGTAVHESVQAGPGKLTEVAFVGGVVGQTTVVGVAGGAKPGPGGVVGPVPGGREETHVPYWNGRRTVGVVIAGVGVVGMVVGGVFGAQRGGETSDANAARTKIGSSTRSTCTTATSASVTSECAALSSALNSNSSDAHAEEILLVGGGVLVAVGLITALWPNASPPPATALVPMTGPHVAGFMWNGSF
jgi:hypothetical protein